MTKKTSRKQKENGAKPSELENDLEEMIRDNEHVSIVLGNGEGKTIKPHDEMGKLLNKFYFSSSDGIGKTRLLKNVLDYYQENDQSLKLIDFFTPSQKPEEKTEIFNTLLEAITKSKRSLILLDTAETIDKESIQNFLTQWSTKSPKNTFILKSNNQFTEDKLTPKFLLENVAPYLSAIGEIQQVIDEVNGAKPHEIKLKSITQNSPINVNLEGAPEAVKLVQESITPWRRKHAEAMANLFEQEKLAEIEIKKAETLEIRSNAAKVRAEAEKTATDAALQREQAEKIKLENEKLRLDLHRQKIELAFEILEKVSPHLQDTDKTIYLIKLLPHLNTILESQIEMDG